MLIMSTAIFTYFFPIPFYPLFLFSLLFVRDTDPFHLVAILFVKFSFNSVLDNDMLADKDHKALSDSCDQCT